MNKKLMLIIAITLIQECALAYYSGSACTGCPATPISLSSCTGGTATGDYGPGCSFEVSNGCNCAYDQQSGSSFTYGEGISSSPNRGVSCNANDCAIFPSLIGKLRCFSNGERRWGIYCENTVMKTPKGTGASCTGGYQCSSFNCCNGVCKDSANDPTNCGSCGTLCSQGTGVLNQCSGGVCTCINSAYMRVNSTLCRMPEPDNYKADCEFLLYKWLNGTITGDNGACCGNNGGNDVFYNGTINTTTYFCNKGQLINQAIDSNQDLCNYYYPDGWISGTTTGSGGSCCGDDGPKLQNQGRGDYQPPVSYPTSTNGNQNYDIALSDLDKDGDLDAAIIENIASKLSISLNNGDGTYGPVTSYATGNSPYAVAIQDFDNDGDQDIVTTDRGSNQFSFFRNNGDGTFQARVAYTTGAYPYGIAVGDLDNDGYTDVVTADRGANQFSFFRNNGDGTFQARVAYATGSSPYDIAISDFNNDGKNDVAVVEYGSGLSVFRNNGDGTFQARVAYNSGNMVYKLTTGDVNSDGYTDIITASWDYYFNVFKNNGDGSFQPKTSFSTYYYYPAGIAVGDVDGDLDLDVVLSLANTERFSVNKNGPDTLGDNFNNGVDFCNDGSKTKLGPGVVYVSDLDRDTDEDVALAKSNGVSWLENINQDKLTKFTVDSMGGTSVYASDINNDLSNDLIIGTNNGVYWYDNKPTITRTLTAGVISSDVPAWWSNEVNGVGSLIESKPGTLFGNLSVNVNAIKDTNFNNGFTTCMSIYNYGLKGERLLYTRKNKNLGLEQLTLESNNKLTYTYNYIGTTNYNIELISESTIASDTWSVICIKEFIKAGSSVEFGLYADGLLENNVTVSVSEHSNYFDEVTFGNTINRETGKLNYFTIYNKGDISEFDMTQLMLAIGTFYDVNDLSVLDDFTNTTNSCYKSNYFNCNAKLGFAVRSPGNARDYAVGRTGYYCRGTSALVYGFDTNSASGAYSDGYCYNGYSNNETSASVDNDNDIDCCTGNGKTWSGSQGSNNCIDGDENGDVIQSVCTSGGGVWIDWGETEHDPEHQCCGDDGIEDTSGWAEAGKYCCNGQVYAEPDVAQCACTLAGNAAGTTYYWGTGSLIRGSGSFCCGDDPCPPGYACIGYDNFMTSGSGACYYGNAGYPAFKSDGCYSNDHDSDCNNDLMCPQGHTSSCCCKLVGGVYKDYNMACSETGDDHCYVSSTYGTYNSGQLINGMCPRCACGNGVCNTGENCANCPSDCGSCCGNGACDNGENCNTCSTDCGACCGNGACDNGENCNTCAADCGCSTYKTCVFDKWQGSTQIYVCKTKTCGSEVTCDKNSYSNYACSSNADCSVSSSCGTCSNAKGSFCRTNCDSACPSIYYNNTFEGFFLRLSVGTSFKDTSLSSIKSLKPTTNATFTITEEVSELTYLDKISLITVEHPINTTVAYGIDNNIYLFNELLNIECIDGQGNNCTSIIRDKDSSVNSRGQIENSNNGINATNPLGSNRFTLTLPNDTNEGYLLITLSYNDLFADFVLNAKDALGKIPSNYFFNNDFFKPFIEAASKRLVNLQLMYPVNDYLVRYEPEFITKAFVEEYETITIPLDRDVISNELILEVPSNIFTIDQIVYARDSIKDYNLTETLPDNESLKTIDGWEAKLRYGESINVSFNNLPAVKNDREYAYILNSTGYFQFFDESKESAPLLTELIEALNILFNTNYFGK